MLTLPMFLAAALPNHAAGLSSTGHLNPIGHFFLRILLAGPCRTVATFTFVLFSNGATESMLPWMVAL
ncbi:MAG: hypothetical protein J0I98_19065 [Mesorhizobium sp.]|nr:hypothetical protein [Mesorhizobium sp.]MBN9244890.1 hypothetical protein [Mesorhizobium sp.]